MVATEISGRRWLSVGQWLKENPGFSKNFVYESARDGRLISIKVGGKVLVASDALDTLFKNQKREG